MVVVVVAEIMVVVGVEITIVIVVEVVDIVSAKISPSIVGHTLPVLMTQDHATIRVQGMKIMPHSRTNWVVVQVFAIDGNKNLPMEASSLICMVG